MSISRKFSEPITVYDAYGRPTPEPVLVNEHRAFADPGLPGPSYGPLVTPDSAAYPVEGYRLMGNFFASFYNRVYVIPRTLALVDPLVDEPNSFFLWNAFLGPVELQNIVAANDTGFDLSFGIGLQFDELEIKEVFITVTAAAPVAVIASYQFFFDNGSVTPLIVDLLRTNLLLVVPERPVKTNLSWKTEVLTARNGTEQRFGLRQIARHTLNYRVIYENAAQERQVYEQFFARGMEAFSVPVWHEPIRLLEPALLGATQIEIDTARYDIRADDQLYIEHEGGGSYEIVRVQQVQLNGTTVSLFTSLLEPMTTAQRFYRVVVVDLPVKPSLRRGPFQSLESDLELRVITDRDIFTGDAATVPVGIDTQVRDRVIAALVYTLGGVPILNARPLMDGAIRDEFDWNYEVIDYETGPVQQTTAWDRAMVTVERKFYSRYSYQRFFYGYILNYMHGQRKPVWLPTWQEELNDRVSGAIGNFITISDEQFFNNYPADSSHRGLWIRHTAGWLPRRIVNVTRDGEGNSLVEIEPALPLDFPTAGPYRVGFLTLSRLGSDEVEFEHLPAYSMISMSFSTTNSTAEGV